MGEKRWSIITKKDTMLHVMNNIFKQNVRASMTKENILQLVPGLYKGENLVELIKMLSYESYQVLENILKCLEKGMELSNVIQDIEYEYLEELGDAMILVTRTCGRDIEYTMTLNANDLAPIFSDENKKLAKRYDKIEKIVKGLVYSYGAVEIESFRKLVCKCMHEIIPEENMYYFIFTRLNLNLFLRYHYIHWENSGQDECYLSYLDSEEVDVSEIAAEQKSRGLKYKSFKEKDVLSREEYFWNEASQKFYEYLKGKNESLNEEESKLFIKRNELGEDILDDLIRVACIFDLEEANEFMAKFMEWYNNSPQYFLGGYTPAEMMRVKMQ